MRALILWHCEKPKDIRKSFPFRCTAPRLSCLHTKVHCIQIFHSIILIITTRSELRKILFWRWCWLFLFVHEVSREPLNGFTPNSQGRHVWSLASLGRVWMSRAKVKVTRDKNGIFRPFRRPACGFCLVKHLWPLVIISIIRPHQAPSPGRLMSQNPPFHAWLQWTVIHNYLQITTAATTGYSIIESWSAFTVNLGSDSVGKSNDFRHV